LGVLDQFDGEDQYPAELEESIFHADKRAGVVERARWPWFFGGGFANRGSDDIVQGGEAACRPAASSTLSYLPQAIRTHGIYKVGF